MVKGTKNPVGGAASRKGGLGTARKAKRQVIFYLALDAGDDREIACAGMDPTLFVGPDSETTPDREFREATAKQVCAGCPLRTECLQWALDMNERGVWGGTNDDERRALRRRRGGQAKVFGELTPQQERRIERERTAWLLHLDGVENWEIAQRLSVTTGTVYEYIRAQRKANDHGATDTDPAADHPEAGAPSGRPADSVGEADAELTKVG